ncbi:MAG: quinolinate synthase NadA [Dehalococcoidia bacterium]|nr:quinolinate synthase NadA [Dehalococcoidia bacterium]
MKDSRSELRDRILELKKQRSAVILVHNYQLGEVQDIGDFVGDSLELSQVAAETDAGIIVFCGVHFMAETASILCPDKKVLLPVLEAGCPMANMITAQGLRDLKKQHPGALVMCYVNTTAEVKAESDICCTSANAVQLAQRLEAKEIIFVPDHYLGHYVSTKTGKPMILWPGYCPTHARIQAADIGRMRRTYPRAEVMVHPECRSEVSAMADFVLSTGGMIRHCKSTPAAQIVVGTEMGIIYRLRKENPDKMFIPLSEQAICPDMKLIGLENILRSLEYLAPEVKVPEDISLRAKKAVDKMIEVS